MLRYHQGHLQFKTFGYNQGRVGTTEVQQQSGPAIDPQSGTGMTSYPTLTLMQSGFSRPFYGNNPPMHQGGDDQAERGAGSSVTQFTLHFSTASLSLFSLVKYMFKAYELDCPLVVTACANYLEAVPWEDGEEDEMLLVIPMIGSEADPVLARLQPVDQSAVTGIFSSAFRFATSSPPLSLCDIKASAQEQI
ncbi:hypothetical protein F2Q70_00040475 [Brassica cretica]|uniref:Uncharacterized protein n=1 Tax=Brassica cretica TaxID=69181 RepID=A0A8S9KCX4_BRACR|nr:hypothetical protein F2Q70_00040475 [Brassica cretica]